MDYAQDKRKERFEMMEGGKGYTTIDIEMLPEGERAELIDGEMFMMAPPSFTHQEILVKLIFEIEWYIRKNKGKCKVIPAPFGVYIKNDNHNFVEPDISVICDEEKRSEKGCHGAPDWVIEIVSLSSKKMDYVRKTALYHEAGVREYWIVDPNKKTVTVYEAKGWDTPVCHSFSTRIKVGIYEDLFIDFSEKKDS